MRLRQGHLVTDSHSSAAVRRARREDVEELVALCQEHAEFEGAAYDRNGKSERLASALFSPSPRLFARVAVTDGLASSATPRPRASTQPGVPASICTWTACSCARSGEGAGAILKRRASRQPRDAR
jgi:hypothetical protein